MAQADRFAETAAREVMWIYTIAAAEHTDKEFYVALEEHIVTTIKQACQENARIWVGRELRLKVGPYNVQARLTNIEPVLATSVDILHTTFYARYRARAQDEGQELSRFISEVIRYPNKHMEGIYEALVGLDAIKVDMVRKLNLLLRPAYLHKWLEQAYPQRQPQALAQIISDRYPLFLLEGEVGSGKTALARSIGSRVAQRITSEIVLFVVNAQVRGGGHVGELTQNLSRAFDEAEQRQEREQMPVIMLIDEADSLAQARGSVQTHHEDDAGVNTLIQRIDRLRGKPLAVIFATNLTQSLDSAILRRACASYHFDRPTAEQRAEIFRRILLNTNVSTQALEQLVSLTEPRSLPAFGAQLHRYTYSDLAQRLLPRAIEDAVYKNQSLSDEALFSACQATLPTPETRRIGAPGEKFPPSTGKKRILHQRKFRPPLAM